MTRHPNAIAWEKWIASNEGKKCLEGDISGKYLENRLWWAFMAGRQSLTTDNERV